MGLGDWTTGIGLSVGAKHLQKEYPMLSKITGWFLNGPPGRKRRVGIVLLATSIVLRHAEGAIREACAKALVVGASCAWDLSGWAGYVDQVGAWFSGAAPTIDFAALVMGVWGVLHAKKRAEDKAAAA